VDAADQSLGMYEDQELFLKNGKYGYYVEWGEKRESIKQIKKPVNEITYDDIITFLKEKKNDPTMLRVFNDNLSVRKGKYGPYIFYKTADMKKPSFFNIKKCPFGFLSCTEGEMISWINDTYKQNI
jgi:topoisomerase IA-like protein